MGRVRMWEWFNITDDGFYTLRKQQLEKERGGVRGWGSGRKGWSKRGWG